MKVTLRRFLEICEDVILFPWTCAVLVEVETEFWGKEFQVVKFGKNDSDTINSLNDLEPYLDYEVVKFAQETIYDEIEEQALYLRKIEEEGN